MKVNHIIFKGLLIVSAASLTACSDFLEEKNWSSQSAEQYYETATGFESLMNGAYASLKTVYNNLNYYQLTQLGTDLGTQNNGNATSDLNQYVVTYTADNSTVYNQWKNLYTSLKNVNAVIDRSETVKTIEQDKFNGMKPELILQHVAEAKFLRALYLFEIVKNWGQAPLVLHEPTSASTMGELNSASEFYEQILSDLSDVLSSNLPEKQPASDFGRVSKAAAKHLRALVYLTRGYQSYGQASDFQNAYADAVDVINNSGHKLLEDYAMVHRQSNEGNEEVVFAVNFNDANNYMNNLSTEHWLFSYREGWEGLGKSNYYGNDFASVMPTKYTYLLFDWKKDHRTEVTFMSPFNGEPSTSIDGRTLGRNAFMNTDQLDKSADLIADTVIYFPVPVETGFKKYTQEEQKAANQAKPMKFIYNYPSGSYDDCSSDDYYETGMQGTNQASRAWLPVYKFKDAGIKYNEGSGGVMNGSRDIVLFRLAETYLIAAEAAVKLNDNANALKYINVVRQRAMNHAPESGLALYTGTVTIDDVLDERALELFGEAPRWNDLTRTGKLAERVLKYNWDVNHITGGVIKTQLSKATEAKYSLRPIPTNWLSTLSNGQELGNNPGWE